MEPTIYKPGVYNKPGIYNGSGGIYNGCGVYNMGGNEIPLPNGCLLCDYFKNGYRLGIKQKGLSIPTENYIDGQSHNLDYIEHSIFGGSFPAGRLDSEITDTYKERYYNISGFSVYSEGTIEYLIRFNKDYPYVSWGSNVILYNENNDSISLTFYFPSNSNNTQCGFTYRKRNDNTSTFSGIMNISSYPIFSGESNIYPTSWKHVSCIYHGGQLKVYVNGKYLSSTPNDIELPKNITKLYISPYAYNVNGSVSNKACYYDITQLAVWNYARYTDNFTIPNKLIIDPNYT